MARPLVVVFQELAQVQATPSVPDLNSIILGPAYDLLDYPDDAASIQLSQTYGQLDQPAGPAGSEYVPPVAGSDAVTVNAGAYPAQSPGSLVDHASVRFIFKFPRVVIASTSASVTPQVGTAATTTALDRTLITLGGMISDGFITACVRPGDKIILTSSQVSPVQSVVRTVASVGEPNPAGLVDAANYNKLRISQELPDAGVGASQWTYNASTEIRIERELPITEFVDTAGTFVTFPEPGSDKLVLKGGVSLNVALTPAATITTPNPATTIAQRKLSYATMYLAYRALRQDKQSAVSYDSSSIVTVNNIPIVNGLGKIDARNPLATAVYVALQNSGTAPIYAYGVASDDGVGHTMARADLSSRRDLYCFVPLTQDIDILAAYKTEFAALADPNQALANGVVQKFRVVVGSIPLPTATTVYPGGITSVPTIVASAATNLARTISIGAASTGTNLAVNQVLPSDTVTIGVVNSVLSGWQNRRGIHKVSHVNTSFSAGVTASEFEVVPGTTRWDSSTPLAGPVDIEFTIVGPDGTVKASNLGERTVTQAAVAATGSITAVATASIIVGETFTVGDGTNPATIFEFTAGGAPAPGNVAVDLTALVSAAQVATAIQTAINGVGGTLLVTAAAPVGAVVGLTADVAGTTANVAITDTVANAGFLVSGMSGGLIASTAKFVMNAPTIVGGPYTIGYAVSGGLVTPTVSIVGFAITVTVNGTSHTVQNVIDTINTNTVTSVLITASLTAGSGTNIVTAPVAPVAIEPVAGSCLTAIATNDALFNQLVDAGATFITSGVEPGDTIEIPVDPNNYLADAFEGQLLTYTVATVQSETSLLIANGVDDTDTVAKELPHYYLRNLPNRLLDVTLPTAVNYRIRRVLTKDQQVSELITVAQSVREKRLTITWSDQVQVSDLRNGGLPRSSPTVRQLAGWVPGYYISAQVAGAVAGLPAQHGLTNLALSGINNLLHSQGYFTEEQLTSISDGGFFVMIQRTPGALPICIHQLTTDPTALETGEFSVVKNVDFVSKFYLDLLEPFIGVYNVTQSTMNEIEQAVNNGTASLTSQVLDRVGPPLISGTITSIAVSESDASRIEIYFRGTIPRPLNTIAFHLVV